MRVATSPSTGRPYGLALVCRVWKVARATVYRRRVPGSHADERRATEVEVAVHVLNRMLDLGRPDSVRIA